MADDDEYIYDEVSGEWLPASEIAARNAANLVEVKDAAGNVMADGDAVVLIKDLKASLDEWEDGTVVDESENEKLYEAVQADLDRVIDRIDEDEHLIDEAWKIAATEWLNQ